jgi:DNA-binding transcriptional ArsR family regulator
MKRIDHMNSQAMRATLRITKALSDIQRIRILMLLRAGELCVCQIIAVLGLAPSTVSKHLSVLSEADLVISRKEGRWSHYRLPQGEMLKVMKPVMRWLGESLEDDATIGSDEKKRKEVLGCSPERIREGQRR